MKKLKQISGIVLFAMVMMCMPMIANAAASELPQANDGVITLTEDVTLSAGYVVKKGENITLNLAGHTLTTATGLNADTIYVEKGSTLTITGNGTVTVNAKGYATVFNNGTTVIDGATLKRDTTGDNYWYILLNHGTMTIKQANVSVNGTGSSLVENGYYNYSSTNERLGYVVDVNEINPKLTIEDGLFDGGMNTIKNDDNGELIINGGKFQNNYQVSVMNWNIATINGGTYETPTGNDKTNIFVSSAGAESVNKGILVINGGTFNAEYLLEGYQGIVTPIEINGGTFNYTNALFNTEKTNATLVNDGVKVIGKITAPASILKYAKKGSEITLNNELTVGEILNVKEGVTVYLSDNYIGKVVLIQNEDGTITVEESADLTKLFEILEKIEALDETKYTDETVKSLSATIDKILANLETMTFTKNEQDKVNTMIKELEDGMNALVKKTDVIPVEKPVEPVNPQTGDSIMTYVTLGFIAMVGMIAVGLKLKIKEN